MPEPDVLKDGNICLSLATCQAFVGRRKINLTASEFNLLACLLENCGAVLSRRQLLSSMWGDSRRRNERTVDTHIQRLRHKLGKAGQRIHTIRGVGYELTK